MDFNEQQNEIGEKQSCKTKRKMQPEMIYNFKAYFKDSIENFTKEGYKPRGPKIKEYTFRHNNAKCVQ